MVIWGGGVSSLYKTKDTNNQAFKKTPFFISKLYCQPLKVCPLPLTIHFLHMLEIFFFFKFGTNKIRDQNIRVCGQNSVLQRNLQFCRGTFSSVEEPSVLKRNLQFCRGTFSSVKEPSVLQRNLQFCRGTFSSVEEPSVEEPSVLERNLQQNNFYCATKRFLFFYLSDGSIFKYYFGENFLFFTLKRSPPPLPLPSNIFCHVNIFFKAVKLSFFNSKKKNLRNCESVYWIQIESIFLIL